MLYKTVNHGASSLLVALSFLDKEVNELLKQNWVLYGQPTIIGNEGVYMVAQAMTKEEKTKREFLQEISENLGIPLDTDLEKEKKEKTFIDEIIIPE